MTGERTESISQKFHLGLQDGEYFGTRYRIIEEVGCGGMGKVYKAFDLELEELVALKIIKPEFTDRPDVIARFKRELVLARAINHENVIRIHDLGECDGIKYISMRFIEGQTLKALIQDNRKLAIGKVLAITRQICSALQAAHEKGIIHRDLKSSNIMLDHNGKIYVLDFGIACSLDTPNITKTGMMLGTPDYMSPEQIMGTKSDIKTDIYSLGVIIFEMVTGRLPFIEQNPVELIHAHLNQEPAPPSQFNSQIPKYLENIILKCLQKKPEKRYAHVGLILQEIGVAQKTAPEQAPNNIIASLSKIFNVTWARQPATRERKKDATATRSVSRLEKADDVRRKKIYPIVAVLGVLEIIIIISLIQLLLPVKKEKSPIFNQWNEKTIVYPPHPPPHNTLVSLTMASHMADIILQRSHPFSQQIGTQRMGQNQNVFFFVTCYQGTIIKEYNHKMVWRIELDSSNQLQDFVVVSDTSPFNSENKSTIRDLLAGYIKKYLMQ